jgi:hypothetical protein
VRCSTPESSVQCVHGRNILLLEVLRRLAVQLNEGDHLFPGEACSRRCSRSVRSPSRWSMRSRSAWMVGNGIFEPIRKQIEACRQSELTAVNGRNDSSIRHSSKANWRFRGTSRVVRTICISIRDTTSSYRGRCGACRTRSRQRLKTWTRFRSSGQQQSSAVSSRRASSRASEGTSAFVIKRYAHMEYRALPQFALNINQASMHFYDPFGYR